MPEQPQPSSEITPQALNLLEVPEYDFSALHILHITRARASGAGEQALDQHELRAGEHLFITGPTGSLIIRPEAETEQGFARFSWLFLDTLGDPRIHYDGLREQYHVAEGFHPKLDPDGVEVLCHGYERGDEAVDVESVIF